MNIFERLWFRAKTGADIRVANRGRSVEQKVIRIGDYYIEIMFDTETGEPCDWGWSEDPGMFNVPVRDFYVAYQESSHE